MAELLNGALASWAAWGLEPIMIILRRIIVLGLFCGLAYVSWLFAVSNAEIVRIDYLLGSLDTAPVWMALLGSAGIGAVLVGFFASLQLFRSWFVGRRYRKAISELETEVHQLRNLPLAVEELSAGGLAQPLGSATESEVAAGALGQGS